MRNTDEDTLAAIQALAVAVGTLATRGLDGLQSAERLSKEIAQQIEREFERRRIAERMEKETLQALGERP